VNRQLSQDDLNLAHQMMRGTTDVLTNLVSRYFSITKAADTVHPDRGHLAETIREIAYLRRSNLQHETTTTAHRQQITDLRVQLHLAQRNARA
jgi:hypothetical protein